MTSTLDSLGRKLPESLFVFGNEANEMGEAVFNGQVGNRTLLRARGQQESAYRIQSTAK